MYKIAWVHLLTAQTGEGEPQESLELATAWINWANKEFPDMWHWVQPV